MLGKEVGNELGAVGTCGVRVAFTIILFIKSKLSVTLARMLGLGSVQSVSPYDTIPTCRFVDTSWKGP